MTGPGASNYHIEQRIALNRSNLSFINQHFHCLVGALASQELIRLQFDGDKVIHEERLLAGLKARIRDVRQGPDGFLYVLTDEDNGVLYRVGLNQD